MQSHNARKGNGLASDFALVADLRITSLKKLLCLCFLFCYASAYTFIDLYLLFNGFSTVPIWTSLPPKKVQTFDRTAFGE